MKLVCGIECERADCRNCDAEILSFERGYTVMHLRCLKCNHYWIAEVL